jgi:acyl carrier protein
MSTQMQMARRTIARVAGCPVRALHPSMRLATDLDLTPLELVLIATEIEEAVGIEVPVEGLASVETVGEMMRFFRRVFQSVSTAIGSPSLGH